tara:strand:+ start:343 stop:813 length:471 start_codon:yes stop_codon:yes gene_type:complete
MYPADIQDEIVADEGKVLSVYLCPAGHKTCGVGHLVLPSDPEHELRVGARITEDRCSQLFSLDLEITLVECERLLSLASPIRSPRNFSSYPIEVQKIIANMMFNLGRPRLSKFRKFLAAIEAEDWATAADEMGDSLWARQLPKRSGRLIDRMRAVS